MARTKKTAASTADTAVKAAEAAVETAKTAETAAPAAEEKAIPAKKPAAKRTAAAKKTAEKKPAVKKNAAKKAAPAEENVFIQQNGAEVTAAELIAKAKASAGVEAAAKVDVYVRPEINMVYYVINGEIFGNFELC